MLTEREAISRSERLAIAAAIERLVRGEPRNSDGSLTVVTLAAEAGLRRHHLTHKHTDLQAEFRRRVAAINAEPVKVTELREERDQLAAQLKERGQKLREAERKAQTYASNLTIAVLEIARLERVAEDLRTALAHEREGEPRLRPL